MTTYIFRHLDKHLCAMVISDDGNKFIDYIEKFCTDWKILIEYAKEGFSAFPYYDRYKNHDEDFWERYMDIYEGIDEDYELIGAVSDGVINFERVESKVHGEYFASLEKCMRIAEAYDFDNIKDIVCTADYVILSSDDEILICSNVKIPFEPKGEEKVLRELIREKLSELHPYAENALCAQYGCVEAQTVDIENALFYNIGTASFNNILTQETPVYFHRVQPNGIYIDENINYKYLYRYSCSKYEWVNTCWGDNLICEWNNIPLEKVNSSVKATEYFLAVKNNQELLKCFADGSNTRLGLKVKLFIPKSASFSNVACAMKPMIDGIICALHTPKGIKKADEICNLLNIDKNILCDSKNTCLGDQCYIRLYRDSVKWDPQDDRLVFVLIEPSVIENDTFSFSGQFFSIPCYM